MCAANLFSERFFSHRQIPWHGLGVVSEEEKSAVEIFSPMSYIVTVEPMYIDVETNKVETSYRSIVRYPTPDDPEIRVLGVVGSQYTLVDPLRTCEIFDEAVNRPVETLGVLGQGETLFISTKLSSYGVKGDPVESYLLLKAPFGGNEAIEVRVTPVRVVCQNTLTAATRDSVEAFRVIHDASVEERMRDWMVEIVDRAEVMSEGLAKTFEVFANIPVAGADVDTFLESIYVDPKQTRFVPDKEMMERRRESYEYNLEWAVKSRQFVKTCFEGAGTGFEIPAMAGTLWGLDNAVVEVEDYRPTTKPASRAQSALFGERATYKARAYSEAKSFANIG